ncbi:SulP family inorganic anion transporter [Rhodobacteraceae bacterium NNCM2]|nr:SulP family inorganic anion transporter [Coraliihabitans acroporae]
MGISTQHSFASGLFSGPIKPDAIAGLTAAAVVLPKAMAYAAVAGLPVSVGLYTTFVPMIIYAFLGTSRVLSVSSTTTLAILTGAELGSAVPDGDPAKLVVAVATLTVMSGIILVIAGILRFGFVANFISAPVLTGFKAGIGLVIIFDQVPKLLGLHFEKEGFFRDILALIQHLPESSMLTVAVGGCALVALFLVEKRWAHSPAPLAVVAAAIAASWFFGFEARGTQTVGLIPQSLPSLTLPDIELVRQLLPGALGIALMSFTETIAAGRAFADRNDPAIRADRELFATGASNLGGAFFGAMPAGGGTSQTAVVRSLGGKSQKASLFTAAASAATMLALAPLLGLLPQTVLAAIVIVYSAGLISPSEFASILKIRKMEFRWAIVALLGVLVFGTLQGIVVAIVLSLVSLAGQMARPDVYVLARERGTRSLRALASDGKDELFEGLLMLRPEGRLFFVNAQQVGSDMRAKVAEYQPGVIILDLSRVFDIEYSALQMICEGQRKMAEQDVEVWLAGMNPKVGDSVRAAEQGGEMKAGRVFNSAEDALEAFLARGTTTGARHHDGLTTMNQT